MTNMIRTRWLVAFTVIVVAGIGVLVYRDETERSEAALEDLGEEQALVARAASLALGSTGGHTLAELEQPNAVVVITRRDDGKLATLDGHAVPRAVEQAFAQKQAVVRVEPEDARPLGLPERTAMLGFASMPGGGAIGVARSAEHQRDRDRIGRFRVILSMLVAALVMSLFAVIVWWKQRSEGLLARRLAVAETSRTRDAELDRLSRAATMAALGSGVAHELSTPLAVIVGRAEQLVARCQGDERAMKSAQTILEQADHINEVVRGLLGLARGAPIALQETTPRTLVREAAALVEHRFRSANVTLFPAVGAELPPLRCEPLLFKHALVNLMLNACDASPPNSTVRVEVRADAAEMAFVVTDEGEGITSQNALRAVEPFFTTKPAGQGTGLGLAIANEIAKTHRGSLDIVATPPRGTRACIRIPIEAPGAA